MTNNIKHWYQNELLIGIIVFKWHGKWVVSKSRNTIVTFCNELKMAGNFVTSTSQISHYVTINRDSKCDIYKKSNFVYSFDYDYLWWSWHHCDAKLVRCAIRIVICDDYWFSNSYHIWYCNQCTANILQVLILLHRVPKV